MENLFLHVCCFVPVVNNYSSRFTLMTFSCDKPFDYKGGCDQSDILHEIYAEFGWDASVLFSRDCCCGSSCFLEIEDFDA